MEKEKKLKVETAKSKSPQVAKDREFQELVQTRRKNNVSENFDADLLGTNNNKH